MKSGIFITETQRHEAPLELGDENWQHWILATLFRRPCSPSDQTLRRGRTKGAQQIILHCAPFCIGLYCRFGGMWFGINKKPNLSIGQNRWIQQERYDTHMNYPTVIGQSSARTGSYNNLLEKITAFPQ